MRYLHIELGAHASAQSRGVFLTLPAGRAASLQALAGMYSFYISVRPQKIPTNGTIIRSLACLSITTYFLRNYRRKMLKFGVYTELGDPITDVLQINERL